MRRTAFASIIACLIAILALPATAVPELAASGDLLIVTTPKVRAVLRGPDLIELKSLETGEVLLALGDEVLAAVKHKSGEIALKAGNWVVSDGVARLALSADNASANMRVRVESQGEIVLRMTGSSSKPGVIGIQWGFGGLDLGRSKLVIPSRSGSQYTAATTATRVDINYPNAWEAQVVVIEGQRASAGIWSSDDQARFKILHLERKGDSLSAAFETENQAPFAPLTEADSTEWHIAVFPGDWRAAAARYKEVMHKLYPISQPNDGQCWSSAIRSVVCMRGIQPELPGLLARHLDPSKTLIYVPNWRRDAYDVNYPDYTPANGLREFIDAAHKLGFKVMLHVNLPGVSPSNPAYESVKQFQIKSKATGQLIGWRWDKDIPHRFAFINPASSEYRKLFVQKMKEIVSVCRADALHLDVSGLMWNDGNGLIEGMNYSQGSMQLHRDLLAALPGTVFGGESVNELTHPFERFAMRWTGKSELEPHPISNYLFGGSTLSYAHLSMPNPDDNPQSFTDFTVVYESQGVVPTPVVNLDSLTEVRSGLARLFRIARFWQDHDLQADWEGAWPENLIFKHKGSGGVSATIEKTSDGVVMLSGGRTIYRRIEGVNEADCAQAVDGANAYDGKRVFGLLPKHRCWVDDRLADLTRPHIAALAKGIAVTDFRAAPDVVSFRLVPLSDPQEPETVAGEHPNLPPVSLRLDGVELPEDVWPGTIDVTDEGELQLGGVPILDSTYLILKPGLEVQPPFDLMQASFTTGTMFRTSGWRSASVWQSGTVRQATCGGIAKNAVNAHPPHGGRTYLTWVLKLPEKTCSLSFSAGLSDGTASEGVRLCVLVNGERLWSHETSTPGWSDGSVDLSRWTGRSIILDLETDSLGSPQWDWAFWADLRID